MTICKKCGLSKAEADFPKRHRGTCKDCENQARRERYARNPERILRRNRQWRLDNPEKKAESDRKCIAKNPERKRQQDKERYDRERSRILEQKRQYRQANPVGIARAQSSWYRANRERVLEYQRSYRSENPERVALYSRAKRARKAGAAGSHTTHDVAGKFDLQGGRCYYCGCELQDFHVDHKIPLARGGSNFPANLCCACPSCNSSKCDKTPQEFIQWRNQVKLQI